jgi:uncharacterized protein YjbI with pentapeptide repeats
VRLVGLVTGLGVAAAAVFVWAGQAQATTCPVVDPSTGAVTPAPGPGVQWSGCDLTGADLAGTNMSSGNLGGADLANANLTGATLTGTDLMSADLTNANLTDAVLSQAMLSGTIMAGATLTGVYSGGISGTPASLPSDWMLANNYLVGPDASLQYANFTAADLTNADLTNANLTDAELKQATLTGATLSGATLTGATSGEITGTPASMPADWSLEAGYLIGPGANLYLADLANLDLSGFTLPGIDLNSADLSGTDLTDANLDDAIMIGTNLDGASLSGASLSGEQSTGITGTPASLPTGWSLTSGYLFGPGADLQSANLVGLQLNATDLSGADLSSADLVDTNLAGATLTGADLSGASADSANLTGANAATANLTGAVLSLANLTDATLTNANLTNAGVSDSNLTGASLAGATLTGASGVGIIGTPAALPADWSVRGGYLLGPGAGTDLTDANLNKLNLSGVDLSGLDLLRTTFQHANLTGANLTKANLTGADFTSANLTRANLTAATVSSTTFADTVWNDTTCPDGSNSDTHPHGWCFPPPPASAFKASQLPLPGGARSNSFTPLTISCPSSSLCFGGGSYSDASSAYLPALLRWAGNEWSSSPAPLPADASTSAQSEAALTSISCPSTTSCFAGGDYPNASGNQGTLLEWSGKNWTAVKAPLPAGATPNPDATVAGMSCPSVTLCMAVGQYHTATDQDGLLLRRSGGKWSAAAAPVPAGSAGVASLNAVSCSSVTLCFAGGWNYDAASEAQLLMLSWSRGKWADVRIPLPSDAAANPQAAVTGISCPSARQCVAVGRYTDTHGNQQALLLTRSGTKWQAAEAPLPAGAGSDPWASLNAVSCSAASHCTAGGEYENTASQPVGLVLTWSGRAWKAASAPPVAYSLQGVSCPTITRCVAVSRGNPQPIGLTGP